MYINRLMRTKGGGVVDIRDGLSPDEKTTFWVRHLLLSSRMEGAYECFKVWQMSNILLGRLLIAGIQRCPYEPCSVLWSGGGGGVTSELKSDTMYEQLSLH